MFDSIVLFMYFVNLKSGIGSCIAPKAGLARPQAKGMFPARVSVMLVVSEVSVVI